MKITKKTEERIKGALPKFQKVLGIAKDRDLNESDTVSIITDMLSEIFGYDKYLEVTSELQIRSTYCDIAIKIGEKFQYLIECKAIGTDLKENHLRQAVNYGVNKGIPWVILTNGIDWQIYRIRFEQPVSWDLVARIDLQTVSVKNDRDLEKLFIVTKEGVEKSAREELHEKMQCVNRFTVAALLLAEPMVLRLRKELRKLADDVDVDEEEIISLLKDGVFRRDLLEGEEADAAMVKVAKHYKQQAKKCACAKSQPVQAEAPTEKADAPCAPVLSVTERILAEAEGEKK